MNYCSMRGKKEIDVCFCIFRGFNVLTYVSVEHEYSRPTSMEMVLQSGESISGLSRFIDVLWLMNSTMHNHLILCISCCG